MQQKVVWPKRSVSYTFSHENCGDNFFHPMVKDAMDEYMDKDPAGSMMKFTATNGVTISIVNNVDYHKLPEVTPC